MRTYGGELANDRREKRRTALLDAAVEIIHGEGPQQLAVRRICTHAQLNDRYFYESFATVDEVLIACFDRAIEEVLGVLVASMRDPSPDVWSRVRATVTTTLDHLLHNPESTTVLLVGRRSPVLADRSHALINLVVELFISQVKAAHGDPTSAATRLGALALVNGELNTVAMWLEGQVDAQVEDLVDHLVEAIVLRLDGSAPIIEDLGGANSSQSRSGAR